MRNQPTYYALSTALASVIGLFLVSNARAVQFLQPPPSTLSALAASDHPESMTTPVVKVGKMDKESRKAQRHGNAEPGVKGHEAHMGTKSRAYTDKVDVRRRPPHEVRVLPHGTNYIAVIPYDDGQESSSSTDSAEVTRTIPYRGEGCLVRPLLC